MSEKTDIPTTDEELVAMHKKARKRRRRRRIITVVVVVAAIVIFLAILIVMLRNRVTRAVGPDYDEVISFEVTEGSITTSVSGSGTLIDEEEDDIDVPASLEIMNFYVEEGENVKEGELIATVTSASLMGAMSDTQEAIDELDERLSEAAGDTVSSTVTSSVSGRVKAINVAVGDEVATAMYRSGSLMVLSLDGYMAVDVETDALRVNDSVTVTMRDGTSYDGRVRLAAGGVATVVITDDGPQNDAQVTVSTRTGTTVGSGTLYIHSPMSITGYTGTVETIAVSENTEVSAGTTLLTLTDTETSANYDTLLVEREELEEQLDTLIGIYKEGGICAPAAGTVVSIDESLTGTSSGTGLNSLGESASSDVGDVTVATISLGDNMLVEIDVDESDILSLSEGQAAYVTIDSIGEETYEGTVTEISTTASGSSGVTSYTAEIAIPKSEDMLSGMSASVRIVIEGVDDALLIPLEALHQTSSTAYVYTEYDEDTGEFSGMREVTAGLANSNYVEITSGLEEGDVVWYTPSEDSWFTMMYGDEDFDYIDMDDMPAGDMGGGMQPGGAGDMGGGRGGEGGGPGGR